MDEFPQILLLKVQPVVTGNTKPQTQQVWQDKLHTWANLKSHKNSRELSEQNEGITHYITFQSMHYYQAKPEDRQ